jgi:S1-C subfamily serine protease
VYSDAEESYLVTSYAVVEAATRKPSPTVTLRKGEEEIEAQIWNSNPGRDLALLVIPRGGLPVLPLAPATTKIGDRTFAVAGIGGLGASVTEGLVADVSADGLQHTAPLSDLYRGSPLIDEEGRVVGVGSRSYSPLNFLVDDVWFAPGPSNMCESTLNCGDSGPAPGSAG